MIKLKSLLKEEEEVVKNKKTGNVYVVKNFDASKHDKPTPAEIEKAKAANNGQLPKGEPQPPQTPKNTAPVKPGQKLGGSDFKSSAETPKNSGIPCSLKAASSIISLSRRFDEIAFNLVSKP